MLIFSKIAKKPLNRTILIKLRSVLHSTYFNEILHYIIWPIRLLRNVNLDLVNKYVAYIPLIHKIFAY